MKKQHFKRIYGIILALLGLTANTAAYDFEADGLYYNITSVTEFTASVAGVADSTLTHISIPETVTYNNRKLTVTEIGKSAFKDYEALKSVSIPNTVTSISDSAFYACSSIKEITLPESLESLGGGAFYDSALQSIRIPNKITTIKYYPKHYFEDNHEHISLWGCFDNCDQLEEVILPEGLTTIEGSAFWGCTSLKEISLPESLQTIGVSAFASSGLISFDTKRVTNLDYHALDGCKDLEEITFNNSVNASDISRLMLEPSRLPSLKRIIFPYGFDLYGTCSQGYSDHQFIYTNFHYALEDYDNIEYLYTGDYLACYVFIYYNGGQEGRYSGYREDNIRELVEKETTIQTLEIGGTCTEVPFMFQKIKKLVLGSNIAEFDTDNLQIDELKSIACYAATPPALYNYDNIPATVYTDATVYVPAGSIEAYQAADGWRGFWNIQEAPAVFLNLNAADTTLIQGETFQLQSRIVPRAAIDKPVAWSSSDEDVATVSETGLVTALETGTAIITATCEGVTATCEVKVMDNTGIETILPDRNTKYTVYNLQGILIRQECTLDELQELPKGIYILTNGKERFKVAN